LCPRNIYWPWRQAQWALADYQSPARVGSDIHPGFRAQSGSRNTDSMIFFTTENLALYPEIVHSTFSSGCWWSPAQPLILQPIRAQNSSRQMRASEFARLPPPQTDWGHSAFSAKLDWLCASFPTAFADGHDPLPPHPSGRRHAIPFK